MQRYYFFFNILQYIFPFHYNAREIILQKDIFCNKLVLGRDLLYR